MKKLNKMNKKVTILFFIIACFNSLMLHAQDDKIKFGAVGRAFQEHNKLGGEDTLNVDNTSSGHVLVDLGININPDRKTEIQAIIRFRNELGGFFGGGASAALRQAYVKGIIGNFLNYQVGDMYLQLSPYTLFNNYAEGSVNEGRIFSDLRKDYTYYDNLNRGNFWWQQGAHTNFSLAFEEKPIDNIRFDVFFLRNRTSNGFSIPTSFHAGGKVTITQSENLKIAANYLNLFDVGPTIGVDSSVTNPVSSLELDYRILNNENMALGIFGEGGYSNLKFSGKDSTLEKNDYFYEAGVKFDLKRSNLSFKAGYMYVGPEFFSSGAQSKRVNFSNEPIIFPIYGNDPFNPNYRNVTIFDLVRDPGVYNAAITRELMPYDPTLANAMPYGKATPNRKGFNAGVQYKDSLEKIIANADAALLSDVAREGAPQRNFMVLSGAVDFNIHKFIGFKKKFTVTAGVKYESTKRSGDSTEKVNLSSNLIDLGLELEVLKKLDLLLGAKMLMAEGNEFIPVRNEHNGVIMFAPTGNFNISQSLLAFGLKYRFSANTYLTVQDHMFEYKNKTTGASSYSINQILILFNMNF